MPPVKGCSMPDFRGWPWSSHMEVSSGEQKGALERQWVWPKQEAVQLTRVVQHGRGKGGGMIMGGEGSKMHLLLIIPSYTRIKKRLVKLVRDRLKTNPINFSFVIIWKIIELWVPVGLWECQSLAEIHSSELMVTGRVYVKRHCPSELRVNYGGGSRGKVFVLPPSLFFAACLSRGRRQVNFLSGSWGLSLSRVYTFVAVLLSMT